MCRKINLGFSDETFDQGVHICHVYSSEEERKEILEKFVASGMLSHECTTCFSDNVEINNLSEAVNKQNIDLVKHTKNGDFSLSGVDKVYFVGNEFNPDKMLQLLTNFYQTSVEKEYSGARVIGDMLPKVKKIAGGERLLEYESRVTLLQKKYPVSALCQYNANEFDGATIMDVLKVHPLMIVNGGIVRNPFFIAPEEFLKLNYS